MVGDDYILLERKVPVILIVDDTRITLEIMAKILSNDGYKIETAMNGRQALDIVRKVSPDLVLLDVVMPEMDGYEVCRILKESTETKDIPVIFITVKNEMEDILMGFEVGAVDYVTKPFNAVELLARVRNHAELKRKRDNEKELICRLNATLLERNREEEEARKERDRAEKYLDIAGFIFIVIKSDQAVSLINKAGCDILKYKSEEIIGKNWFDMFLPEREKEKAKDVFKKLFAGEIEPVRYHENVVLSKDGKEKLIAWHNTILRNEKGQIIATLSSGEDITEHKLLEEALRKSEEKYRAILENASDAILLADEKGNLIEVNRKAEELLGYKKEELLQMHYTQLHPMIKQEKTIEAFTKIVELGRVSMQDGSVQQKDGKVIPVHITGSVIEYAGRKIVQGSFRDITELKRTEEELERRVQERTAELNTINEILSTEIAERKQAESSLKKRDEELSLRTVELEEANTALRVLLKHQMKDQKDLEERLQTNVNELVIPFIKTLRNCNQNDRYMSYLNILESNLRDIVSPFLNSLSSKYKKLTPKEIRVVGMIKDGMESKEIAEILGVSTSTVSAHRENIRKKLGLLKEKTNLRSFLISIS